MLVGYARVSTSDQDLKAQTDALDAAGCERIFTDHASGAKDGRPGLHQALDFCRAGDTLVVWKLDRLGRSLKSLIGFVEGLRERGIAFRSLQDGIDTSTSAGRFFFHVMGALAEMERDLVRERTQAGLAAARRRGKKGGRPRKLDDRKFRHAKQILQAPEATIAEAAETVGVSYSTLWRALQAERQRVEDRPTG